MNMYECHGLRVSENGIVHRPYYWYFTSAMQQRNLVNTGAGCVLTQEIAAGSVNENGQHITFNVLI
jgi:hypothetical protein